MGCAKDIVEQAGVPRFLFSDFPLGNPAGKPKDTAQVVAIARYFAALDDAGDLERLFACGDALTSDERRSIEREEGWILGALAP